MTKRSKWMVGLGSVALAALTIAAIVSSVLSSLEASCEVCVTFHGHTVCREAFGVSDREAADTAKDNACALLAGGMTDTIQCSNTEPDSVTCSP